MSFEKSDEEHVKQMAQAQVESFIKIVEDRYELNDQRIKTLAQRASTNGKIYITYSVVVATLLGALAWMYTRETSRGDTLDAAIEKRMEAFDIRQIDVRERLRVVEAYTTSINERTRAIEERTRIIEERTRVMETRNPPNIRQ